MSRCFPYPPPGYKKNGISDEALIESIKKRQREEEKARKEKKKQRKLEKKEKDKSQENGKESEKGKHRHEKEKRHKGEKDQEGKRSRDSSKKRKRETQNLEKSNLTEEHGQPMGSQNSSDSTLNSDSKRHKPIPAPETVHNSGSIIRIRLPLQRHKDPVMSLPIKEQPSPAMAQVQRPLETPLKHYREQIERHSQPCFTSQNVTPEVKVKHIGPTTGVVPNHRPTSFLVPGKEKKNLSSMKTQIETVDGSKKQAAMGSLPIAKEKQKLNSATVDTPNYSATATRPGTEIQKNDRKPLDAPMVPRPGPLSQKHDRKPVVVPMVPQPGPESQKHVRKSVDAHMVPQSDKEKQSHIPSSESVPKESKSKSKSSSRRKERIVTQFNDLFDNWVPLPVHDDGFCDEDWLFETKRKSENGNRACEIDCSLETYEPAPPSLWPQALFLPAADVYALPYAVPF